MERKVNEGARESITERLSSLEDLYFPRALESSVADRSQRKSILFDLLSRDVAVFLERYGLQLTSDELREFDDLSEDYETKPSTDELRLKSVMVKNRRRAYLDKLVDDGQYFSEDAMREREPYLHHEYIGRFQDPRGRSDEEVREAILVAKIRAEQQRRGEGRKGRERGKREERSGGAGAGRDGYKSCRNRGRRKGRPEGRTKQHWSFTRQRGPRFHAGRFS